MKETPILFSTPMVQALLAGKKTITRRIVNPQPITDEDSGSVFDGKYRKQYSIHDWRDRFIDDWSRWMPEDILWVRESFWEWDNSSQGGGYAFKADFIERYGAWEKDTPHKFHDVERVEKWKPSIHMPKEASRIWLQVADIKIERLHDISEEDAKKEGVELHKSGKSYLNYQDQESHVTQFIYNCHSAKDSFKTLWTIIHGFRDEPYAWFQDPWVWVIEFKILSTTGKPAEEDPTVCDKCGHPFHMHDEEAGAPCPVY